MHGKEVVSRSVEKCFLFFLWRLMFVYTWYQSEYQSKEIKRDTAPRIKVLYAPHKVTHNSLRVIPCFVSLRGGFWVKQMIQIPAVSSHWPQAKYIAYLWGPSTYFKNWLSTEHRMWASETKTESAAKGLISLKKTPQLGSKSSELNATFAFITMGHN